MPPAKKTTARGTKRAERRIQRCVYTEGGARCRRSGTGDPPLCNPHRIVMQDAGRPPPAFGNGIRDLVDRFVNGKRINRKVWEGAIGDIAAWAVAQNQQQHQEHRQHHGGGAGYPPPPPPPPPGGNWGWVPNWARPNNAPPPPPSPDPGIEARKKARKAMGFTQTEELTLEMLQKRRRELARKHHPDRGGSVAKMQEINAAADVLEAHLKQS